jgi:Sec-independent protein translocase protein TatA
MSRSRITALFAVPLAALALGACGSSPEDEARDSGEDIGKAIAQFQTADSAEAAGKAIDDFRAAVADMKEETREQVREQAETQASSLQDAVDAFQTAQTATDAGDVEGAQDDLKQAGQDIRAQAQAFQSTNDSVAVAFWEGVEEGYDDEID